MVSSPPAESPAAAALRHSPIPALRNLRLDESADEVVIEGCVSSYYLKQLAQESLMTYLDGRGLRNRVRVERA